MTLKQVNLTTGPVSITKEVRKALSETPISHRSPAFEQLYGKTTALLCSALRVKETFLLSGSGTLANEVMIQEIKGRGKGLMLSNGEFGYRLIEQSCRNSLDFITYELPWGVVFDMKEVENLLAAHSIKWILFCHCETSTGIINDMDGIIALSEKYGCLCFVDCMSTVGTRPLNLSKVAMATASSGKGLASVPGLAIVFSNIEFLSKKKVPVYFDLSHYSRKDGIPFTISSNLVKALSVSIVQKLKDDQFGLVQEYSKQFFSVLNKNGWVPFSNANTRVYTIAVSEMVKPLFIKSMEQHKLLLSHESDYLKARNWMQLATFGYYTEAQLKHVLTALRSIKFSKSLLL